MRTETTSKPRRRAGLVLFLLLGAGCSSFAEEVCTRETAITEAVATAGEYFGPIGDVAGTVVGFFLGVVCGTVDVTASAVDAIPSALGLMPEPAAELEEPPG